MAVGLDRLAADFELDALTYYYRGLDGNEAERLGAGVIVGNSLLTARGIPTAGEGDLKTNLAQLVLDRLGAGGSYTEYYGLDFDEDFVLMGHDGPAHLAIAQEQPVLRALKLYHGKRGAGLSVEVNVRYGPVTIVGCTQTADGRLKLLVAEGESIPGATFRIGNTNSRLRFGAPPAEFFEALVRRRARPTTSRSASATWPRRSRRVGALLGLETAVGLSGARLLPAARPAGPARRVQGAPPRGVAGDARRAARDRLDATTRCSCARTGCWSATSRRRTSSAAVAGDGGARRQRALAGRHGAVLRRTAPTSSALEEVFHLA